MKIGATSYLRGQSRCNRTTENTDQFSIKNFSVLSRWRFETLLNHQT